MSNMFKLVTLIFLGFTIFFGNNVFADARPVFENREVEVFPNGIVRFQAEYDSNDNNYFPINQPITWFAFGDDRNDLHFRTPQESRLKGNYIVDQGATLFQQDTVYYVQTFMLFDGEINEGEIKSFNPYILTPIPLTDQQVVTTAGQNVTLPSVLNPAVDQANNVNTSSSSTPSQLRPPLNNTFNFLDFSQFRNRNNNDKTSSQENNEEQIDKKTSENARPEQDEVTESISLFKNSATNSDNNINIIKEKDKKKVIKTRVVQENQFSASAASSGVSITNTTYFIFVLLMVMISMIVFLLRFTNKKKRSIYRHQSSTSMHNHNRDY